MALIEAYLEIKQQQEKRKKNNQNLFVVPLP